MQPLYLKQSKLYDPKTIEEIVKHTKKWNILQLLLQQHGQDPASHSRMLPLTNHFVAFTHS